MALDQHGALLKMVVIFSQHHLTGRPCWSGLSWFICLSTRLWERAPLSVRRHRFEAATAHGSDVLWPSPHPTWPSVRISAALLPECPRIGRCEMCSPEAPSCTYPCKNKGSSSVHALFSHVARVLLYLLYRKRCHGRGSIPERPRATTPSSPRRETTHVHHEE